ncbi:hypothetical protein [Streptomyces sp. NPDC058145]|uniref:hypothetical protein n=1 Tax=Streptomyces sp. NPDC058145 TaxID=3346356 RepID=UPI0036E4CC89
MYEKPDLDTRLARLRENITKWQASLKRHTCDERRGKGFAYDIALLDQRDDIAAQIVQDFGAIDEAMPERRIINSAAPSAWTIDRLTDDQLAAVKADWPDLALFNGATVRQVADVLGTPGPRNGAASPTQRPTRPNPRRLGTPYPHAPAPPRVPG